MANPEMMSPARWTRIALVLALFFGIPMGAYVSWKTGRFVVGVPTGIAVGILFGFTFTWRMKAFTRRQISRFRSQPPNFGMERILMEGPANHFQGVEGVGGYLWVTDARIHFSSHSLNIQNHTWSVSLTEVTGVQAVQTLGFIDNGLWIIHGTGEKERFIVNNSTRWAEMIRQNLCPQT